MCKFQAYPFVLPDFQHCPGREKALEYEKEGCFSHSSQSGGYYRAILDAMINPPDSIEDVPKTMNSKGFEALSEYFRGNVG